MVEKNNKSIECKYVDIMYTISRLLKKITQVNDELMKLEGEGFTLNDNHNILLENLIEISLRLDSILDEFQYVNDSQNFMEWKYEHITKPITKKK